MLLIFYCVYHLDEIRNLEVNNGFIQRSWAITTTSFDLYNSYNESLFYSFPNNTSTVVSILPYTLYTSSDIVYRIQGYWRPYLGAYYTFIVTSDVQYKLIVEQAKRVVKFCNATEKWYVFDIGEI